jgi:hypothetical protein
VLTPLTPKHTSFEVKSSFFKSPYAIKEFMISKVMLLALDPKKIATHSIIMVSNINLAQCSHAQLPNL